MLIDLLYRSVNEEHFTPCPLSQTVHKPIFDICGVYYRNSSQSKVGQVGESQRVKNDQQTEQVLQPLDGDRHRGKGRRQAGVEWGVGGSGELMQGIR